MAHKGLGRGLDAFFSEAAVKAEEPINEIEVGDLRPNPYQPRKEFDPQSIQELSISIQQHGIVQPLIVRKSIHGYEIIAGERRWRAAKQVNLATVPVVVRDFSDEKMMEIALVENLQREDLNPIEMANAYQKLLDRLSLTQESLSERVGKSRPHITNFLRLLQLPLPIQEDVSRGTLSMGHARALLGVKDEQLQYQLSSKVKREKASVRQLEEWIQQIQHPQRKKESKAAPHHPNHQRYEELLQQIFHAPVKIKQGRKKGKIEIEYFSERELERLMELLHQDRIMD